jgi:hypothetical protein
MTREEVISSPEYWLEEIEGEFFRKTGKELIGRIYISEFLQYCISEGFVPYIQLIPIEEYLKEEQESETII